jgi:ArsR family metal-binding transcriptional regulator
MAITKKKPIISTACPAVVELIMIRFTNLKDNLLQLIAPVDIAAKLARQKAMEKTGLPAEKIGVFFISPCPAKVYALKSGFGFEKPNVDGVLSTSDIYFKLLPVMKRIENPRSLSEMGIKGLQWAGSGGEAIGFGKEKYIAADGIDNVINILRALEDGKLHDVDFIELNACVGGCVGGVLNIENPFIAKSKLRSMRKYLEPRDNTLTSHNLELKDVIWEKMPETHDVIKLDEDRFVAMKKLIELNKIYEMLPQLDCGSCGAPSCKAFAEDVVNGLVDLSQCTRKKELDKEIEAKNENEINRIYEMLPRLDCGCCEARNCRAFAEDVFSGKVSIDDCVRRNEIEDKKDFVKEEINE